MAGQGLRYVRYADDFSIYAGSKAEARKIGNTIYFFLRDKWRLPINREKSGIRRPVNFELLGHGFVSVYMKGSRGQYQLVVKKSAWQSFKRKLKDLTRKTRPMSFDERLQKLAEVWKGGVHNFRLTNIHAKLKTLDEWLRNRLRYCIWSPKLWGEKTRAETQEPDSSGSGHGKGICLQSYSYGRLGGSSKPHPWHDHYLITTKAKRV